MKISWSSFHSTYDERTVKRHVPAEAGTYLLWVKLKEGKKWRCFYVGQARNLEARLLQHLSSKEDNDCLRKKASGVRSCFVHRNLPSNRIPVQFRGRTPQFLPACAGTCLRRDRDRQAADGRQERAA